MCISSSLIQTDAILPSTDSFLRVTERGSCPLRKICVGQAMCVKSVSLEPSEFRCLRTLARETVTAWEVRFLKAQSSLEACKGVDQEAELLKACYSNLDHLGSRILKVWRE